MTELEPIPLNAAGLDIENESMRIIDAEVPLPRPFGDAEWPVVRRMIHASADFELLKLVRFHPRAVTAGLEALRQSCPVITDTRMAQVGLSPRLYAPLGCVVHCLISDPETLERTRLAGSTRAAAAVDVAAQRFQKAIWVVGNAPTALLRLLELIHSRTVIPALVIGMPVGFVQAEESKQALLESEGFPFILIHGRKGGSALAASALNALACMALTSEADTLQNGTIPPLSHAS